MSSTDLQLPTTQRSMPLFKEQRRQKFEEYLARKKAFSSLNLQEKQITSNTTNYNKKVTGDSIKKIPKTLKLTSTKMDDKENVNRPIWRKNILTVERNGIPLKSTNILTNSTVEVDVCYPENCDQTIQVLPNEDDPKIRSVSLSQTFRLKRNSKEKQLAAEKLKQDATLPKKPVLGSYRGRVVQSKVNSFRKPSVVTEEGSMTNKTTSTTIPKTQSVSKIDIAVKGGRTTSITSSTKSNSIPSSQNKTAFQSSRKNQVDAIQNKEKEATVRTAVNVTIRREPLKKRLPLSNPVPPNVKTNLISSVKENEASSKYKTPVAIAIHNSESKPASTFSSKFREDSKIVDKRRYTLTRPPINTGRRTTLTKESAEERRARLLEWQNDNRRVIKRPPISGLPAPSKMELPKEKPVESFWTTIAEEDEQRLFTDKVNKIFSEYLNLINKGCPREEVLLTLDELIVKIPDAKKLVKYWVCLARLEPITSPLENIIAIYEKAILAGAQPMEEMRHTFADILTMKSQVTANSGENADEVCSTNEEVRKLCEEVINQDKIGVVGASTVENSESNDGDHKTRNVKIQAFEREQEDKAEDSNSVLETPDKDTRGSYVIKYNVSTTPYLQSVKKKMNVDENSSSFKDLKFLTPVRRSRRLQEKFCKLPDMLKDHYPCVSSLEQLAELGSESSAYICRPNTALFASSLDEETKETEKK
ncbi:cytoskeleton-associated protein 2 isoform X2 [Antechinus flavipes]|uniref:cytoskeleton-associated protein 2 isoform X2 n=1 Tax=Antechinus flavipes TaxID=38775 RepID=UPI00223614EC|nr:cytoskeleton-associated protein 2 isoform X2 [Antechinus flavipes]